MKRKRQKKSSKQKLTSQWSTKTPLLIDKKDKRYKKCLKQLKRQGFCCTETWNLGYVIIEFALPRLKMFREINAGYPGGITEAKWNEILDKIIIAFEWAMSEGNMDEKYLALTDKEKDKAWVQCQEGIKLFSEWVLNLWW